MVVDGAGGGVSNRGGIIINLHFCFKYFYPEVAIAYYLYVFFVLISIDMLFTLYIALILSPKLDQNANFFSR